MIIYWFRNPNNLSDDALADLLPHLPQQQQDIVANIKNHRHRCEQVIAYIMLCYAIEHNLLEINGDGAVIKEYPNSELRIQYSVLPFWSFGEHGKPYIINYEGIHFNISHCGEAVAVAVSDREVGIDVEGRRKFSDGLLQRAFSDEEQTFVLSSADPEKDFARIWTRKEAWFKYTGTGILLDHLKTTEADAKAAGCEITTVPIVAANPEDNVFWLSIAQ